MGPLSYTDPAVSPDSAPNMILDIMSIMILDKVNQELVDYVERKIIPLYDHFDKAHRRDHVQMVIRQSMELAGQMEVDADMVYAIAAYHDVGLCEGRERHHIVSGQMLLADDELRKWFTDSQLQTMAEAVEDHRASSDHAPRSLYGRIVAEADRFIDPVTIIRRTVQYGLEHYPELDKEAHFERTLQHLHEKYGRNGYLHLWFDNSSNAERLEQLRQMMGDEKLLREIFEKQYVMRNVDRIGQMEQRLDRVVAVILEMKNALADFDAIQEDVRALDDYLGSDDWKSDLAAEEGGLLPSDLKCGVLSEDGIWNALEEYREMKVQIKNENESD